jgi:hypothetical protein
VLWPLSTAVSMGLSVWIRSALAGSISTGGAAMLAGYH